MRTTYAGACEEAKLEEVLAQATYPGDSVEIDCDLYMEPQRMLFKRLVFTGSRASGVTVELNGATLSGGDGTQNDGREMIEARSEEVVVRDVENAISSYERPSNITIRNGRVNGSIRLWGMAKNMQNQIYKSVPDMIQRQNRQSTTRTTSWETLP